MKYKTKICGEVRLEISHNLVCKSGNMEDIQTVASHAQPLAQCREWLRKNLPSIPTLPGVFHRSCRPDGSQQSQYRCYCLFPGHKNL